MFPIRVKTVQESDLRMLGSLARNIQRVLPVTQADIDAAAALGKGWVVWKVFEVSDPLDNLRGGTQLIIRQNNIQPGQNVRRVIFVAGPGGQTVVIRGTDYIVLSDAIANSLQYVKAFGGTEQRNLPDGYIERQYIYMMDGSYIRVEDLPISAGYKVEFDFQVKTLGSTLRNYLGGRVDGVSAGGGFRLSKLASGGTNLNRVVMYGFETGTEYYDPTTQFQANTRYKYTYDNGVCTLESGGSVIITNTFTPTDTTSTDWGINDYCSNGGWSAYHDGMYVYSVKVWNDQGELVMDLVPAVQKGTVPVVGFYDAATGGFRGPTGGTFAAGPELAPTPDAPMDIVCNNGVIKVSPNLFDGVSVSGYINDSGADATSANAVRTVNFIPVKPNTQYTFSASGDYTTYTRIHCYDSTQTWISMLKKSNSTNPITVTTPANAYYLKASYSKDYTNVQIEQGATVTTYRPYGTTYTDGTVETINVHTKNLFDQSTATRYRTSWTNSGGGFWQVMSDSSEAVAYGSYVKPNTTYTLSKKGGSRLIITGYRTKTEPSSSQSTPADYKIKTDTAETVDGSYTFTTPADCTWILFGLRQNNTAFTFPYDVQLEQGSAATEYAPYYDGGTATTEMLLKVGDYQDVQSIIDGVVTRNVGVKVLDGTEAWEPTSTAGLWLLRNVEETVLPSTCICTHFLGVSTTISGLNMPDLSIRYGVTGYNNRLYIRHNSLASVDGFKQILADQYAAGTPVIVVYPLATPTTESVAGQTLQVTDGDNVLTITQASLSGLELEAEYQAAVSLTIQEVQDANLDNNVEVTIS